MTYNEMGAGGVSSGSLPSNIPSWLQLSPKHLSGNNDLDKAHEEMFAILQKIYLAQFSTDRRGLTEAYLDSLETHLDSHFQQEELMQRRLGFPGHEDHMIEHAGLLIKFRELREQHRNGLCSFGDLFRFMGMHFVKQHLETSDAVFHEWLAGHPLGSK